MTELALILGIQGAALAFALVVGRAVLSKAPARATENQDLERFGAALERASSGFFERGARVVALGAVGASGSLLLLRVLGWGRGAAHLSAAQAGLLSAASVVLGAAMSSACAYFILRSSLRASLRVAQLRTGTAVDRGLHVAVRAGGAASLVCEALSALGLLGAFGTLFTLAGGAALPQPDAIALGREVIALLTGFPLGAALTALVFARASGTYRTASTLGAELAVLRDCAITPDDRRNPALVGGIAGEHLVEGASRGALLFLIACASQVALVALGLALVSPLAPPASSPGIGLFFLPLLVRAFFLLASPFAFSVVRLEEPASPSAALARGQLCALLIGLSGLVGSALWLTRAYALQFFGAGLVTSLALVVATLPGWTKLVRSTSALRESGVLRATPSSGLSSVAAGLETTLIPTLALGLGAVLVFRLGTHTGLPSGGLWASLVGSGILFGCAPFAFAVSSTSTLASTARGALSWLDREPPGPDLLDETHVAATSARAQVNATGIAAALVCVLSIPVLGGAPVGANLALLEPIAAWCGALGVALVLAYTGSSTRAGVRGAREVAGEVDRQTRGVQRDQAELDAPNGFSARYDSCVELAARSGLYRLPPYAFGVLSIEALTALGLHLSYRSSAEPVALRGLTSFVLFAAVTGFAAALAIDAARTTLSFVRRPASPLVPTEPRPTSASAGVSDLLGGSASPAAQTVLVAAAAAGLALAPFLTN